LDYSSLLAQINSEIELEDMAKFMDSVTEEEVLAQIGTEITSEEILDAVKSVDPEVYHGLAQLLSTDYFTQVNAGTEEEGDFGEVTQLLGQLDTEELTDLTNMLEGVNDGLAQVDTNDASVL